MRRVRTQAHENLGIGIAIGFCRPTTSIAIPIATIPVSVSIFETASVTHELVGKVGYFSPCCPASARINHKQVDEKEGDPCRKSEKSDSGFSKSLGSC